MCLVSMASEQEFYERSFIGFRLIPHQSFSCWNIKDFLDRTLCVHLSTEDGLVNSILIINSLIAIGYISPVCLCLTLTLIYCLLVFCLLVTVIYFVRIVNRYHPRIWYFFFFFLPWSKFLVFYPTNIYSSKKSPSTFFLESVMCRY